MATDNEELRESSAGNSIISLFMECPRKWYFRYVLGWRTTGISIPLCVGSAVHEGQEVFYKNNFNFDKGFDRAMQVINDLDPTLEKKVASSMHIWNSELGRFERDKVEVLMVEQPISIKLPNGFSMTGRLDRLLRDKETGHVFISDSKTTGWDLTSTLRNYSYHPQPKLYMAGFKDTYPELAKECIGWKTDAILCKERISKGMPTGEFYGNAERSSLVSFLPSQLEDTRRSYASYIDDMSYKLALIEKEGELPSITFPACGGHCLAYNKVCEYYNDCHKVDENPSMPHNFTLDPWVKEGTVLNNFRNIDSYKEL